MTESSSAWMTEPCTTPFEFLCFAATVTATAGPSATWRSISKSRSCTKWKSLVSAGTAEEYHRDMSSFRDDVYRMYDRAVTFLALPPGLSERIKTCSVLLHMKIPVRVEGDVRLFDAYRAQHSFHRKPVKGG